MKTISSNLGRNQLAGTLTVGGWILVGLLWFMCPVSSWNIGHCVYYINELNDR